MSEVLEEKADDIVKVDENVENEQIAESAQNENIPKNQIQNENVETLAKTPKPRSEKQKLALLKARESLTQKRKKVKQIDDELKQIQIHEQNLLLQENRRLKQELELEKSRQNETPEIPEVAEIIEKPREQEQQPSMPMMNPYQQRLMMMSHMGF